MVLCRTLYDGSNPVSYRESDLGNYSALTSPCSTSIYHVLSFLLHRHLSRSEWDCVASHKAIFLFDGFFGLPLAGDAAATAIPGRSFDFSFAHLRMLRSSAPTPPARPLFPSSTSHDFWRKIRLRLRLRLRRDYPPNILFLHRY